MSISKRAEDTKNRNFLRNNISNVTKHAYHPITNPQGVINLGTAENKLIEDVINAKMNEQQSFKFQPWMQYYFADFGIESFRTVLAKFIHKRFKAHEKINPDNLAVTLGCGAAMDIIIYLITDPGDCVLIMSPFYSTTENYLFRDGVKLFYVFPPDDDFVITSKELEDAHEKAIAQGYNVKAVMMINPDNPTGQARDRESLEDILEFCHRHDLHAVINECYALSSFKDDNTFCSVLSLPEVPLPEKTHFLWGFSKDFGVSGLRCGVLHTKIDLAPFATLFFMEAPPAIVQDTLTKMISDEKWLDEVYFPTNLSRMKTAYGEVSETLRSMGVVPFAKFSSGFFIWSDFTKIMKECTKEEEIRLYKVFYANGVHIIPGHVYHCPFPGWFRVAFTYQTDRTKLGLERLRNAIKIYRNESGLS